MPAKLNLLGGSAFEGCTEITSITMAPECPLTYIQDYTFASCRALETFIPSNNITRIGTSAFRGCYNLETVEFSNKLAAVEEAAFAFCSSLASVTFNSRTMTMGNDVFQNCPQIISAGPLGGDYSIKFGWTEDIPDRAFRTSSITSAVLPNTITRIGDRAFEDCDQLTSISLPNSLETIGYRAFSGCLSLHSIDIPASVISVSANASNTCLGLRRVNIRFTSSDEKVQNADDGWFTQTLYSEIDIHIPSVITLGMSERVYGPYWNCHSKALDGSYNMISYTNDL